ncbi:MAG: hypothetical protein Athens101428_544 [Candidatus Berkelbacteria bacterium Athens1014_28]|uniref:Uncharacterized protein n=1 Tax=Candidatus Berkelbacteria bacterium Athens1014_28 TaxID=2017145 RepID=A0A554LLL0_9BACT|nr:MAG: hypothetical protein Athens101428_544 [Candidatus Berkelbacteria bacterium Athens1014_28]
MPEKVASEEKTLIVRQLLKSLCDNPPAGNSVFSRLARELTQFSCGVIKFGPEERIQGCVLPIGAQVIGGPLNRHALYLLRENAEVTILELDSVDLPPGGEWFAAVKWDMGVQTETRTEEEVNILLYGIKQIVLSEKQKSIAQGDIIDSMMCLLLACS